MKNKAVYPGTFDPITNGHIDIIKRAGKMFGEVIVAVAENSHKKPLFSVDERVSMVKRAIKNIPHVEVASYEGLLVNYLKKIKRRIVIRGLRAIADFEYEFQLNLLNKKLGKNIEMIYMMPKEQFLYISSSAVKEMAHYGQTVKMFVPEFVEKALKNKSQRGVKKP